MKTIIGILIFCSMSFLSLAQRPMKTMTGGTFDPKKQNHTEQSSSGTVYLKSNTIPVQQSVGKVYGGEEMVRMARKDVNGIASTVAGVESRAGETPNIRNAGSAGTAYFVDGVRVYGALPILTK